jgi:hypothetical protein
MKKSLLGSFVGLCIIIALDSLSRVIISIYMNEEILMFSYSDYPGLIWPWLLTGIAAFSSFFGAMFALTFGREKRLLTFITFLILTGLMRYGQLHLLMETETLLYPILALIFSLAGIILAWRLLKPSIKKAQTPSEEAESTQESKGRHHHPNDGPSKP